MQNLLSKKLSTFIVTAMMFSASANAQIVYTDVNPDSTFACSTAPCNKSYNLDLNNDGTIDFIISTSIINFICTLGQYPATNRKVNVTSQNANRITLNMMSSNDTIGSSLAFNDSSGILRSSTITMMGPPVCNAQMGSWTSSTDHYLGLRIAVGVSTYYGWVRLNVINTMAPSTFIVKDYAYNSIPDSVILAGQTTTTGVIENSFSSSINLFPNPANDQLTIALGSNNKKVEVSIADITGKVFYKTTATDAQKIEVYTNDFAEGIYVVQIQSEDFIGTKKLVVEK